MCYRLFHYPSSVHADILHVLCELNTWSPGEFKLNSALVPRETTANLIALKMAMPILPVDLLWSQGFNHSRCFVYFKRERWRNMFISLTHQGKLRPNRCSYQSVSEVLQRIFHQPLHYRPRSKRSMQGSVLITSHRCMWTYQINSTERSNFKWYITDFSANVIPIWRCRHRE